MQLKHCMHNLYVNLVIFLFMGFCICCLILFEFSFIRSREIDQGEDYRHQFRGSSSLKLWWFWVPVRCPNRGEQNTFRNYCWIPGYMQAEWGKIEIACRNQRVTNRL